MGTFNHPITVVAASGERQREVAALVDTGPTYLWLPGSLLDDMGYKPVTTRDFIVATGQRFQRGVAPVLVRLGAETWPVPCVLGDEGSQPLLGAMVLEAFSLGVDPVNRRLVPMPSVAMSAGLGGEA